MSAYDEPDALLPRRWDAAGEYTETYPMRVPPQWVAFGLPPRRRGQPIGRRLLDGAILLAILGLTVAEIVAALVFAGAIYARGLS